jgi:hypothetical protein
MASLLILCGETKKEETLRHKVRRDNWLRYEIWLQETRFTANKTNPSRRS